MTFIDHLGIMPGMAQNRLLLPAAPLKRDLRFIMGMIAYSSGAIEGAPWDQWDLHRDALIEAYEMGRAQTPITMYHFLKWHKAILPYGGVLRNCNPVSRGMGESFRPEPVLTLPGRVNAFVTSWTQRVRENPYFLTLADLHFEQWAMHPYPDGNKRHCRLMTIYGCGLIGAAPVCITLGDRDSYIVALNAGEPEFLASLFEVRQVK